jgi:hypothetical protein
MKESLEMQWRAISDGPPQSRTIKVTALLIGLVTALCFGLGGHWYAALAFGLIGYCLTRYVAWALVRARAAKLEMDRLVEDVRRDAGQK